MIRIIPAQRQGVASGLIQTAFQQQRQPSPLLVVLEIKLQRVHVDRQGALLPQVVIHVFITGNQPLGAHTQPPGQFHRERLRLLRAEALGLLIIGDPARVMPQRQAVAAPVAGQRPARQRFAGIPLPLAVVQKTIRRETVAQLLQQPARQLALGRPHRRDGPFRAVHVVNRDKRRLAAHGQAHVARHQPHIYVMAQLLDARPLRLAVGLGDARVLVDAVHRHGEIEFRLAWIGVTGHRCGAGRGRGAGQRNVALAGEQAGGRVQPQPASARHEYFGPGVQIGEIGGGTGRAVERLDISGELDQIAGHEARRQPQMPQDLHQQPGRVAARAAAFLQRLLAGLHARLHADDIGDFPVQPPVDLDQEINDSLRIAVHAGHPFAQQRPVVLDFQIGRQLPAQGRFVIKRIMLGVTFDEEIEGIDDRHFGDQIHGDLQFPDFVREHQPGLEIAEGVLHPVDEMLGRLDPERIGVNGSASVRGGAQADDVRREIDWAVEAVRRAMVERNTDGHGLSFTMGE